MTGNTPARIDRLLRAIALIEGEYAARTPPSRVMAAFIDLGGVRKTGPVSNTLRYAGVTAYCTWSVDHGLLTSWRDNAQRKIARLQKEAA